MDCLGNDHVVPQQRRDVTMGTVFSAWSVPVAKIQSDERPSIFIRDKPIFSSERMLLKDYYRKSPVEKNLWSWVSRGLTPRRTDWR
jgi:hypothetical protein